jgi:hypothetical protein
MPNVVWSHKSIPYQLKQQKRGHFNQTTLRYRQQGSFVTNPPPEPTKSLSEQKAAQTDSLAIEELSGFVSNLSLKRSAARFQGSEGRERFVSKNASRFPFPRLYWHTGNENVFSPLDFEPASTHGPFRQLGDMTHGDIHRLSPYESFPTLRHPSSGRRVIL